MAAGDIKYDGWTSLRGGMNAGLVPVDLQATENALAINVMHRGGYPTQRPGFIRKLLDTTNTTHALATDMFQKAGIYRSDTGEVCLLAMVGGYLYRFQPDSLIPTANGPAIPVTEIDLAGKPFPSKRLGVSMWQAENLELIHDGQSQAIIWNGTQATRPTPSQMRPAICGAYIQGRNWYGLPSGFAFRATDLVYGNGTRENVINETENTFLNEGGDFTVPSDAGDIRAIIAPGMLSVANGQGPVHVFCENKVIQVDAPVDRTTWKDLTYPIATMGQVTNGAMGNTSTVVVNGDVFYRSKDGIRSYRVARLDFRAWGNVPISMEVDPFLASDTESLLKHGSAAVWQNMMLQTCRPEMTDYGVVHKGLVVLDFSPLSTMGNHDQGPAWDGLWTGLRIHQVLCGRFNSGDRCFMFTRNEQNQLELWEIDETALYDLGDQKNRIVWRIESRALGFGDHSKRKFLNGGNLWMGLISGQVDVDVKWRPDSYPGWFDWVTWSECATTEQCFTSGACGYIRNLQPQYRATIGLPKPPETDNSTNTAIAPEFFVAQVQLTITGPAQLGMAQFSAEELMPKAFEYPGSTCSELEVCTGDPWTYSSE